MENKRIYSLNLIAYVTMLTELQPQIGSEGDNLFYAIFPECEAVSLAIKTYKTDYKLHAFLQAFKDLRDRIAKIRGGPDGRAA